MVWYISTMILIVSHHLFFIPGIVSLSNVQCCWKLATFFYSTGKIVHISHFIQLIVMRSFKKTVSMVAVIHRSSKLQYYIDRGGRQAFFYTPLKVFHFAVLSELSCIVASQVCSPSTFPYHTFLHLNFSTISYLARSLHCTNLATSPCNVAVIWSLRALSASADSPAVLNIFFEQGTALARLILRE